MYTVDTILTCVGSRLLTERQFAPNRHFVQNIALNWIFCGLTFKWVYASHFWNLYITCTYNIFYIFMLYISTSPWKSTDFTCEMNSCEKKVILAKGQFAEKITIVIKPFLPSYIIVQTFLHMLRRMWNHAAFISWTVREAKFDKYPPPI